jgi:hypothetical protein
MLTMEHGSDSGSLVLARLIGLQNMKCSEQRLFQNVDSFVVFHLVGVVIQAGEIRFYPANNKTICKFMELN